MTLQPGVLAGPILDPNTGQPTAGTGRPGTTGDTSQQQINPQQIQAEIEHLTRAGGTFSPSGTDLTRISQLKAQLAGGPAPQPLDPSTSRSGPFSGGGTFGTFGGGGTRGDLITAQSEAERQAREANEARFREAGDIFRGRITRAEAGGRQAAADINQQFTGFASRAQQNLISSGLSSSTIQPTVQAGIERERSGALATESESRTREINRLQSDLAGFIERRQDISPPRGGILNTLRGLGGTSGVTGTGGTSGGGITTGFRLGGQRAPTRTNEAGQLVDAQGRILDPLTGRPRQQSFAPIQQIPQIS